MAHRLSDILNQALAEHDGRPLDIATAYFTVRGFGLVQPGLEKLGSFGKILGLSRRQESKSAFVPGSL